MDIIMVVGSVFFFFLFALLIFNFSLFIYSRVLKKETQTEYEPNVTIVIPCYNEEKNIIPCIESLVDCGYPNEKVHYIIIDDGSIDNTREKIDALQKKYNNISILYQKHEGKVEALNKGSKAASTDLIITLDADTVANKDFIKHIISPFANEKVGATSGAVRVKNVQNILTLFQNLEYHQNNLIRNYFSRIFNHGIWFFGSLSCYRKEALEKVGYFKKETPVEDMDIAMEINHAGYTTINVENAIGYTVVPHTVKGLYNQRSRWWYGGLQTLGKNKHMFKKSKFATRYLFFNQYWWSFYAFLSFPLIAYQVYYWFPQGGVEQISYLLRWFSLAGPVYVLYKIPEWGVNVFNIFGVLSGIISTAMLLSATKIYKDKVIRNIFAVLFYFPYTILLNTFIVLGMFKKKEKFFIG